VRANVVGIAPRVSGPIINIPVHDNQEVKAGDLLFEIDPAHYKTALDSAKASVASEEANVLQKQQDLDRETDLFQRKVSSKQEFGDQLLALVDSSSFWIAAYFKETQLLSIKPGRTVKITLMGYHDEPFEGKVDSVAWGIFVQDGSGGTSTGLLAAVNQTVDWVRLPQRFPVRVKIIGKPPIPLRIGQTVTVAVLPKASLTPEGLSKGP
jgi:multidrug resistance efflux pump